MFTKTNLFKFCVAALLACFGAVGCVDDISDVLAPQLSIAEEQQQLLFAGEGGTQIVDIAANCEWSVTQSSIPAWAAITPTSGKGNGQIAITLPEAAAERVATISFELVHPDYGRWGKAEAMVTIHQFPGEIIPDFEEEIIYYNDFDKEAATQTFGSGSSWPFLDQFEGWRNEEGIGAANVDYAYSGLSARNNSNSDSNYSDYAGSGLNNLFFGASAYFTVEKIDVSASNKLKLTFGSEKYLQSGDSTFNPAEFQVTLSADGSSWTDPIEYDFPNGYKSGRWDLASANFTLPEGTETLYIKFVTTVASAYRLDDVKLTTGMGGQQIEFSGAGGGNDDPGTDNPGDDTVIYFNDFDKEAASQTFGSGSSWPFLDQFEGWKNEEGIGAANVDYAYTGMSARNNSNSNSTYSDYAGSGLNNLFFGASAYFTIEKIDVSASNKLKLTFGSEKYLQSGDSTFSPNEFKVTLSNNGTEWSDPIDFSFPNGYKKGTWDLATANFTIPAGTTTLYIQFSASVASAYRLDDVKLTTGNGGQQIEFSGAGNTPGGDNPGGDEETDDDLKADAQPGAVASFKGADFATTWSYESESHGLDDERLVLNGVAITFDTGSAGTPSRWWKADNTFRIYKKSTFTVKAGLPIAKIEVTFKSENNADIASASTGSGSLSGTTYTWTPANTTTEVVTFTAGNSANSYITEIKVTLAGEGSGGGNNDPDPTPGDNSIIYYNDFDKAAATQTFGSGSSWPFLDQFEGWKNEEGIGAANVTYAYAGLSARNNSNSDGNYSDYAGSGLNNLFFGASAYFTIEKIDVSASNKLMLTFGSEKYLQNNDSTFSPNEFKVTLSNNGTEWSDPIDFTFPSGYKNGRWDLATANFTIPAGTTTLYIQFSASVASAYRLDDVKLTTGNGGQQIQFAGSGSGGGTTDPTPDPDPTPGPGTDPTPDPTPGETTVTALNMADYLEGGEEITDANGKTYTFGEFEFTFTKVNSSSSNFNEKDGGVRFYKEDIMKIDGKGKKISKIVLNTYGGAQYCSEMAADSGTATADSAASTITWTGSATGSVTLTASNSQIRFKTVEITWE